MPGRANAHLRRVLLVLEVGLTVVLLVGAGLLLQSYQRLRTSDIGVPVENVLTMRISLPEARYRHPVQRSSISSRSSLLASAPFLVSNPPAGHHGSG